MHSIFSSTSDLTMWYKVFVYFALIYQVWTIENNPYITIANTRVSVTKSCGITSSANGSILANDKYPESYTGGADCVTTIKKYVLSVCQLRFDFSDFVLMQPDGNGNCVIDSMKIGGSATPIPVLCGENTAQHLYANFVGNNPITVTVTTNSTINFRRRWNIKVTQILCNSPMVAPTGCLKYYTGLSQTVESFNYGMMANTASTQNGVAGTRQLANLNYGICARVEMGYCGISWSQDSGDPYSFTLTGDVSGVETTLLGTSDLALNGGECLTDFIIIPNPSNAQGAAIGSDRFCGLGFVPVTSTAQPFIMNVVTDSSEEPANLPPDVSNRGFSLTYSLRACTE